MLNCKQVLFHQTCSTSNCKKHYPHALMNQFNAGSNRIWLHFFVETACYHSTSINDANKNNNKAIVKSAKSFLPVDYQPKHWDKESKMSFKDFVSQWTRELPKTRVLLKDEIDSLYDDT